MANDRIVLSLTDEDLTERSFEPAPEGWYAVEITEVETKESKSAKNPGKPFYALKYKSIDEDKFKGSFFDNVMLWKGAHFSLVGLGKALGLIDGPGDLVVPTEDELLEQELEVRVAIVDYKKKDGTDGKRNEVKGYRSKAAGATAGKAKAAAGTKKGFSL
jgi:hypothetical protein